MCTFYTLVNVLFCIYDRHRMIKAAKRDKNGVLLSAMVSWLALRLDVRVARNPKLANQKYNRLFVDICSQIGTAIRPSVGEVCLAWQ